MRLVYYMMTLAEEQPHYIEKIGLNTVHGLTHVSIVDILRVSRRF
jgi:hypothetical protein